MTWFTNWFGELSTFQQALACAAVPATVILLIQTVLLLFGIGGHDADHGELDHDFGNGHDFDHDHDHDFDHDHDGAHHSYGVRLLTIRGLVAMFAVGGWLGIAAVDLGASDLASGLIAVVSGILALLLVAYIIKAFSGLQESGNLDAHNAVAQTARVYLTIPARRGGTGKVMLTLQERLVEMDAVTDFDREIKTDSMVQVVSATENILVVRPIDNQTP
ncbi:MAG: hypothetical protein ACI4F7_02875 [Acutalibacteraceae bacterium]